MLLLSQTIMNILNTPSLYIYMIAYMSGMIAFLIMAHHRRQLNANLLQILALAMVTGISGAFMSQWILGGNPGKTVIGGIAIGYISVVIFKKKKQIHLPTGDFFAIAISTGEAIGRWGCYFAGCCYGKYCDHGWVIYQHNAFRYPTQIYMSLANCIILVGLLLIERLHPRVNTLFYTQGIAYCLSRFMIEFYREGPRLYQNITTAQIACITGSIYFVIMMIRLYKDVIQEGLRWKTKTAQ